MRYYNIKNQNDNVQDDVIQIDQLIHENKILKNRCSVLSKGWLCTFCPLECDKRTSEYRGDVDDSNSIN